MCSIYTCTLYEHVPNVCCSDSGLVAVVGFSSEVPVACEVVCGVDDGCACVAVCGVDDGCACEAVCGVDDGCACVAVCGVDDGCACVAGDGTVDTSGSGSWSLPEERKEQTA